MKKNFTSKVALAALVAAAGGVAMQPTDANAQHSTSWTGTVGEDRDAGSGGRFKMRGRFQYDLYSSDWDMGTADDGFRSYSRRAFLGVQGRFSENWRYKVDFVLTPSAGEIGVDDAFLEYVGDDWSLVIGEHNITSPLEDRISSLDIPFIERSSIINTFGYGRLAGLGFITGGANWHVSAAAQMESLNSSETYAADEATAISGRFTFAPIFSATPEGATLVHLGVHARHRELAEGGEFRYRTRPLNGRNTRWIDGGGGAAFLAESDNSYGGEVAVQFGPFGAQAEYIMVEGENTASGDLEADGYYVDVYWSLTGESRSYRGNQGSFAAISPARPVTDGGPGHWMLGARYDFIDLSDTAFAAGTRGEQASYAVGLDWVPVDHVRFKLNYAHSDMDRATGTDDEADIITFRTQFDF